MGLITRYIDIARGKWNSAAWVKEYS